MICKCDLCGNEFKTLKNRGTLCGVCAVQLSAGNLFRVYLRRCNVCGKTSFQTEGKRSCRDCDERLFSRPSGSDPVDEEVEARVIAYQKLVSAGQVLFENEPLFSYGPPEPHRSLSLKYPRFSRRHIDGNDGDNPGFQNATRIREDMISE